jgi:hypothetical protein
MTESRIRLIMILFGVLLVYPFTIILLSQLFTPIGYLEALLYSFIVRVFKHNTINININKK